MSSDAAKVTPQQKLKALRKIQFGLDQGGQPTARACGLTQEELAVLANEKLVKVFFSTEDGSDLDRYHIANILPEGWSLLSQAHVAEPDPMRVTVMPPHKSVFRRIYEGTRSGLWDLIKVAFGAVLGWYLKKYFP